MTLNETRQTRLGARASRPQVLITIKPAGETPALPGGDALNLYALPVSRATVTRRGRSTRLPPQFGQTAFITVLHAGQNVHS